MERESDEFLSGKPYRGTCWRGSRFADARFLSFGPKTQGIFFTSDREYACAFGEYIHECEIMLENPLVARESANDPIPDRETILREGHDGLIMVFENDHFVVAMNAGQVNPMDVRQKDHPLQGMAAETDDDRRTSPRM